ncbi:MAG: InlB B-repeat-containing protein [Clostridiales bacterium]|nr:InlB B-repeat-containing protein [Clostridiales bacterium]
MEYGDSAIEPQVELEKGMKFNGWDKSFDFITEDIEISALSEKIMFNVVFKNMCGDIISTQAIAYGEDAKEPEIPQEEGYTFVKWSSKFTKIKSNKEIKAIYKVNKYTVTFLDIDGDAMEIHHVTYGNKAPEPLPPEVEGKIFDGWDTDFSSVKTDLVVKPIYKNVEVKGEEKDNDNNQDKNNSESGKTYDENMSNVVLIIISMFFGIFGTKKLSKNKN